MTDINDAEGFVPLDGWNVVAALGVGTIVTDGDTFYQIGGHSTDESANKQLEQAYARLYNNHDASDN